MKVAEGDGGGWRPTPAPTNAQLARMYREASGRLVLRNYTNLIGGYIWAWLLFVLAAWTYNRTATSPPDAISQAELIRMAVALATFSIAGFWTLALPRVVTYDDATAVVVNPLRTYRVDLASVDSLESSRLSYPRLTVSGRTIRMIGLEQPLLESLGDAGENAALLRGEIENAGADGQGHQRPAMTVGHTNPGLGGSLLLVAWAGYVVSFFGPIGA